VSRSPGSAWGCPSAGREDARGVERDHDIADGAPGRGLGDPYRPGTFGCGNDLGQSWPALRNSTIAGEMVLDILGGRREQSDRLRVSAAKPC
jgi:hypothetical protein